MPTYHEILTTDLSMLTTAAECWDATAKEFHEQEKAYERDVQGITLLPTSRGVSSDAASKRFDTTLKEFQNAQVEAKAIASLLRDAHEQFVDLRKKLQAARDEAIEKGMLVSDQGVVSYDYGKLSAGEASALHHDPDYKEIVRKAVVSWQECIDRLVNDVGDADKGVEVAFKAVVIDSDPMDGTTNGFNGKAQGDIEKYEAQEASDIANRITLGENISAAELAELQRTFRDNAGDNSFSRAFLDELGADGTIRFINELNHLAYDSDKSHERVYMELQGGLADTVAQATQVPGSVTEMPPGSQKFKEWLASGDGKFYRDWMKGLDEYGNKNYATGANPLYGYQAFVSMMQHGDAKYDDQFLYEMGHDLIEVDKKHPGFSTEWGGGHDGVRADALDGLLGVMSKNPDAATAFFDPTGKGNDHLHYLLGSGDGAREWPKHINAGVSVIEMDDPLSRVGLGAALEAAATGHPPLAKGQDPWPEMSHSDAEARVMHGIIEELKPSTGNDADVKRNLRQPLANALAEYTNDTHEILGGMGTEYVRAATGDGYFHDGETVHLGVSQKDLVQVMRGLSDDPDAYATLHKAESRYINAELNKIPDGETDFAQSGPLGKAGAALGNYSAIREDVINSDRMDDYLKADWKSKIAYHIVGGVVTPLAIPTAGGSLAVGDALQRGVDTWAWLWGNDMKGKADAKADAAIADMYLDANNQLGDMLAGWADGRPDIDPNSRSGKDLLDAFRGEMLNSHDRGSNLAAKYM
ncbi:DUF6571 family protein [Streptomyces nodosus]|uniref:Uncharacterized protein n=1 Tax=Streptomyces nodosus TaxID=40318 RepID=A0A0B5DLF7_9ACTN|nr:DUF6571 family protein [Streptomyces nodosus]AJE42000.1 hypothetical protein SNOD_19680 [Streptomyces nodosus]